MSARSTGASVLVIVGSFILLGTALFHGSAYGTVSKLVEGSNVNPSMAAAVRALWLGFSWHLIVLGAVSVVAIRHLMPAGRMLVILCGLALGVDVAVMVVFLGVFAGDILVAASAVLTLVGAVVYPRAARV